MSVETLPLGNAALHPGWPHARFNLSGMFSFQPVLMEIIQVLEDALECRAPVESAHGAPAVVWNAGRPSYARPSRAQIKADLEHLYARGISYFATFSNNRLDANDLKDPLGNYMLDCMNERPELNGVILTSDLLSSYIAERYPALRQVASIVKVTFEQGRGRPEYYQNLSRRFSRVVVHPDDSRNLELLDQLDRDKTEILINEACAVNCPNRARHYDTYARWQRIVSTGGQGTLDPLAAATERMMVEGEKKTMAAICQAPNDPASLKRHKRDCALTPSEVKAVHDMGFRHFKLQGRGTDPVPFIYDLTRCMLEPTFVAPLVFKLMTRGRCNYAITPRDGGVLLGDA